MTILDHVYILLRSKGVKDNLSRVHPLFPNLAACAFPLLPMGVWFLEWEPGEVDMHKVGSHPNHMKKTAEDWLVIAAIGFFYLLIIAMTFFATFWAFQYLQ